MTLSEKEKEKPSRCKDEDRFFERLNEKYNRLWDQETQIIVLVIQIIAGFAFAVLAFDTSQPKYILQHNNS